MAKKSTEFVAHSARVKCSQGSVEASLKATSNTEIGNNLLITAKDTTPESFTNTFGDCKTLNGMPCVMQALPEWFDPNENFTTSDGTPVITMDSILICMNGGGFIRALDSGQTMEDMMRIILWQGIKDGFLEYLPNQIEALQEYLSYLQDDPINWYMDYLKSIVRNGGALPIKDLADELASKGKTLFNALRDEDHYAVGYIIGETGAFVAEALVAKGVAKSASVAVKSIKGTTTAAKGVKVTAKVANKSLFSASNKAYALKSIDKLPASIQTKAKNFFKGGSNSYTEFAVERTANGNYMAKMAKPGNVPGSKAIYYKEIDPSGNTIQVFKETYDPAGNLVHIKPK